MAHRDLWTYHPKPKSGESLSSWLYRIARGNSYKLHTFCNGIWPRRPIWNRDVDQIGDPAIISRLAQGTGTDPRDAWATSLASLSGVVFEQRHRSAVPQLILHVGVYHRERRLAGQQYCPACLREEPCYKRNWRLSFVTICSVHKRRLLDCCPDCGSAVVFHRSDVITRCSKCGSDLCRAAARRISDPLAEFENTLEMTLATGRMALGKHELPALQGFAILRHVERLLTSPGRGVGLRRYVETKSGRKPIQGLQVETFEEQRIEQRHHLMCLTAWLYGDWPGRFLTACAEVGLWHSWALRDHPELPGYFIDLVDDKLLRPAYKLSCEVQARVKGHPPSGQGRSAPHVS